ncbi:PAS domain-containing protein [Brevundimonas sp.]|uniref:PAS domain-containing protein n=1 Tax=Brevundimonas sp. TaxID=1871086 RepID=UPI0035614FC9
MQKAGYTMDPGSWPSERPEREIRSTGPCADIIRKLPWQETPLGALWSWDPALTAAIDAILSSRFPMFLTWGTDHHIFHNDAFEYALADARPLIGRPFRNAFPETLSLLEPLLHQAMRGEATYFEDFHLPLLRNNVLADTWWSFSYSPLRDSEGEVGGVLGVVHETTRSRLAEEALEAREDALRAVTDLAPTLLWRCEPDGRLLWANQKLRDHWRLTHIEGVRFQEQIHPDDRATAKELKEDALAARHTFEAQVRLVGGDGEYRWSLVRSQPIWRADDGDLAGWCGSAVDIDDWRRNTDGRGHEEIFEVTSAEATLIWTADVVTKKVVSLNPDFRSSWALELSTEPTPWEDWVSTLYIEDRLQMSRAFDRLASGETLHGNFRVQTLDGALRWFHAAGFPIVGFDGVIRRLGGFIVDVTHRFDPHIYLVGFAYQASAGLMQEAARGQVKVRGFTDVAQFAEAADALMPGVVVIADAAMIADSTQSAAILKLTKDRLPWLVIGGPSTQLGDAVKLTRLGAANVLDFGASPTAIMSAALASSPDPAYASKQAPLVEARRRFDALGHRQRDVLKGLMTGGSNKSIARDLNLSPRTVETYRAQLMDTLSVKSLAELLKLAAEAGMG